MKLNDSGVMFDAKHHTYSINGKALVGITQRIKDRLFPDEYDNVPDKVLARAAARGSRIHMYIEMYEQFGLSTEACEELSNYIKLKSNTELMANHVRSEYVVTDFEKYASPIDIVFEADGNAILADIKTTYSLNIEYVTWQLSVYKFFFELVNPSIHVAGGLAIWIRGEKAKVVPITFYSEEEVRKLLYTEEEVKKNVVCVHSDTPALDAIKLRMLKTEAENAVKAYESAKEIMLTDMIEKKIQKYDYGSISITIVDEAERTSIDSKALKEEMPEVYERFAKKSTTPKRLLIKLKEQ